MFYNFRYTNQPLSTNRTHMTFHPTVCLIMRRQTCIPRKRLPAHRTYKTLLIGMRPHMLQQTKRLRKRLRTNFTRERFLPGVCAQMSR